MPMRVAVCLSGRGSNLRALLQAFATDYSAEVALVLSDRLDAGGLDVAARHGVPAEVLPDPSNANDWLDTLRRHRVGLLVLAGYVKLVPAAVIAEFRGRVVNVHPALLPAFGGKGMYGRRVHEAVLASGARESGVTVHLVDEVYDRGTTLAQERVPVLPEDTPESLAARVLEVEHRLLPAVVRSLAIGSGAPPSPLESPS